MKQLRAHLWSCQSILGLKSQSDLSKTFPGLRVLTCSRAKLGQLFLLVGCYAIQSLRVRNVETSTKRGRPLAANQKAPMGPPESVAKKTVQKSGREASILRQKCCREKIQMAAEKRGRGEVPAVCGRPAGKNLLRHACLPFLSNHPRKTRKCSLSAIASLPGHSIVFSIASLRNMNILHFRQSGEVSLPTSSDGKTAR